MIVSRIAVAPVKGLGLRHPEAVELTAAGVACDRRYAVVDARGRLANGKRMGTLVQVTATTADDPEVLVLGLPGGSRVGGEVTLGEAVEAVFYGEPRPARLVLGPYSGVLSDLAGEPVRLVRLPAGGGIDRVGSGAVSLQSTASLEALGRELGTDGPPDGRRFRMTFTLTGPDAHEEDTWIGRRVRVGGAVVVPEGHVGRCAVTTQDPDTGRPDLDTLKALARYRGALEATEPLPFGVHARVAVPGRVAVGDEVAVADGA